MGLRTMLLFPGIIVLIAFIIVENATFVSGTGNGTTIGFNGNGVGNGTLPTKITCTSSKYACFQSGTIPNANVIIACNTSGGNTPDTSSKLPCDLADNCNYVPTGAYCVYALWVFPLLTALDNGASVYINAQGQSQQVTSASAQFVFGSFSAGALLVMITVAVGVAALAGITVFGSGENAESVHILFIGGIFLGLWAILSALEGFVVGSPASGFAQMNNATGLPLGTGLYVMLTLLYVVGITGTVSRGV